MARKKISVEPIQLFLFLVIISALIIGLIKGGFVDSQFGDLSKGKEKFYKVLDNITSKQLSESAQKQVFNIF